MSLPIDVRKQLETLGANAKASYEAANKQRALQRVESIISLMANSKLSETELTKGLSAVEIDLLKIAGVYAMNKSGGKAVVSFYEIPPEVYDPRYSSD